MNLKIIQFLKKLQNLFLEENIMIIDIELNEKKQKQLKEVLEYDNNFINNLISKELDKIEENEQISKLEIKKIMKLSEKAKKSPMIPLEDFGKKMGF